MSPPYDVTLGPDVHFDPETRVWYRYDQKKQKPVFLNPQPPPPRSFLEANEEADEAFDESTKRYEDDIEDSIGEQDSSIAVYRGTSGLDEDISKLSLSAITTPASPPRGDYILSQGETSKPGKPSASRKDKTRRNQDSSLRRQDKPQKPHYEDQDDPDADPTPFDQSSRPRLRTRHVADDDDGYGLATKMPERPAKTRGRQQSFTHPSHDEDLDIRSRDPRLASRTEERDPAVQHQANETNPGRRRRNNALEIPWETVDHDGAMPKLQFSPAEKVTDPDLLQHGVHARARVSGRNNRQYLDPEYFIQDDPQTFFTPGRVFKIFWPELRGNSSDNKTLVTLKSTRFQDVPIIGKIRWFVVVKTGNKSCSCVPIATYQWQGVGKKDVVKHEHCIVYTDREPTLLNEEAPREGELGMRPSIRIKPSRRGSRLEDASRLNYGKIYTVEHNVRVFNFGIVHPDWLHTFRQEWFNVWLSGLSADQPHVSVPAADASDEDDLSPDRFQDDRPPPPGNGKKRKQVKRGSLEQPAPDNFVSAYISHGEARVNYTPPPEREARELRIREGDTLAIESEPYDDWVMAFNRKTNQRGLVAHQNIIMHESVVALNDFDPPNADGFASLRIGDVVYVIERPARAPSWAIVWNERTGEQGLAPSDRLSAQSGNTSQR